VSSEIPFPRNPNRTGERGYREEVTSEPVIRRARPEDAEACHSVLWASVTDFARRNGTPLEGSAEDWWASSEPLHRFLAGHAAEWWVAEDPGTHALIGFARSIQRGGLIELTEFFVLPSNQARGLGRALIELAFPADRGDVRSIIATTDVRALNRYYAVGTAARFPILTIGGPPAQTDDDIDLAAERIDAGSAADLATVTELEATILEYGRGSPELRWLLDDREGYLYRHGERSVGYAFIGQRGTGPVGVVDDAFLPDILLHIESRAASLELASIEFQVPGPNEVATRHLLSRGYRIDPWINLLMSNRPFGHFELFLGFGPPVFL
jgi:GNAT superfamily N-acetyltransferase